MSSLIVDVCTIDELIPHDNADKLEIAKVKGWMCIVPKDKYSPGDEVVYFPPDTVISTELAERYGVTSYLKKLPSDYPVSFDAAGRITVARLRGVRSYGLVVAYDGDREVGTNLADDLDVVKYSPPEKVGMGDAERENPFFHKYTDIENLRNFPDAFEAGETIVITEKIHGTNARLGYCAGDDGMEFMAGSHSVRRKPYTERPDADPIRSRYWKPFDLYPQLKEMMEDLSVDGVCLNVIVYGEIYGWKIQDLHYGHTYGAEIAFRIFDICVGGEYLHHREMEDVCARYEIPHVPVLYTGPFSWEVVEELTDGNTEVDDDGVPTQIREGVVIRAEPECPMDRYGNRKIYKNISFAYLNRKGGTEDH